MSIFEAGQPMYQVVDVMDASMNPLDLQKVNYTVSFQISESIGSRCYRMGYTVMDQIGRIEMSQVCVHIGEFSGIIAINGTFISNFLSYQIIPGTTYNIPPFNVFISYNTQSYMYYLGGKLW